LNKFIETVYFHSPTILQNVATSVYGYYLHSTRYGRKYEESLAEILKSQWFSAEEMARLQRSKLGRLITYAYENVPYYGELFRSLDLNPDDIRDLTDLRKVPILEKSVVRMKAALLVSRNPRAKVIELNTSGSTGSPLVIHCDVESRNNNYAFLSRFRDWFGIKMGMRRASFFGRIIVPPGQKKPPFWRYDITENNFLFSSYHMTEENLRHYYGKLRQIRPAEICGYPSSLYLLAKFIMKNGLEPLSPSFVMTSAETLPDYQREMIEKAFGCRVRDYYGCTEMAVFVTQCEQGSYHAHPEYGIVEIVDEEGKPVRPGEAGEVVCTGFVNPTMPLIRYRVGDRAILGMNACACGRNFPVIEQILGRTDDILVTPDGRPLGRLDPVFKGMKGIYETQIVQTAPDTLRFNLVRGENFSEENRKELLYEIGKRTGPSMKIEFHFVDSIPKDKNGKFRSVISMIGTKR